MAECSWNDCTNAGVRELAIDRGQETCETCGQTKTIKINFALCEEHEAAVYGPDNNANVTALIINATGEEAA